MRAQINRLPEGTAKGFAGAAINRGRPLRFRLDGRIVSGFDGDTVLSAALASGIDTLGQCQGSPVGLLPRATPAISHASLANDPQRALPMARTLAQDGAEYVTLGVRRPGALTRLFQPGRTLGLLLDDLHALDRPWRTTAGASGLAADLLVIGGGVAGLAAALAGARAGLKVIVLEARPQLGGCSGLFGTQEGEDTPEESMSRLAGDVVANDAITALTATRAFAVRPGLVRAHQVASEAGTVQGRVIDISAPHIVLATGSLEKLPIFAGNRLPGVIGTLDAFELATRYGVWPGQTALVATSSNPAYRLAMLASDAGIEIGRIFDTRPRASSRFIEFSRAYGMVQSPGTTPASVGIARAGGTLSVHLDRQGGSTMVTDRLLACGGWQPDLTLWHIAGGASQWHSGRCRIEAIGSCDGVALAGSAAGYLTRRGCIQSGSDAVDQVLGRPRRPVEDPVIDPLYETPDGPPGISEQRPQAAPTYLDGGVSLLQRPAPASRRRAWPFWRHGPEGLTVLSEAPQPLAICDVAAGVELGLVPPAAAGVVAQERVALVPLSRQDGDDNTKVEADEQPGALEIPSYLKGRYGPDAQVVRLVPGESRTFDAGALVYRSSDYSHPLQSIGAVLRQGSGAAIALVAAPAIAAGLPVTVRDKGTALARIEPLDR